jgi:ABC-2 type transport system permease protein
MSDLVVRPGSLDLARPAQPPLAPLTAGFALDPRGINWLGLWTLYLKEVRRFLAVSVQTLVGPLVTTLLYLTVFTVALGRGTSMIEGLPYMVFLAPGLTMMSMAQNAFANSSSSIQGSKSQGNMVDILLAPLTPAELTLGYALGGMTRGIMVGCVVGLAMWAFVPWQLHHPLVSLVFALLACLMLSLIGVIGGIWAQKHDQITTVTHFVVTPAAFLSGSFYSIDRLPGIWHDIAMLNPFFYMIDGFRYGFIGHADADPRVGLAAMLLASSVLGFIAYRMFKTGYRLKP